MPMKSSISRSAVTVVAATGWVLWLAGVPGATAVVAPTSPPPRDVESAPPEPAELAPAPRPHAQTASRGPEEVPSDTEPPIAGLEARDARPGTGDVGASAKSTGKAAESEPARSPQEPSSEMIGEMLLRAQSRVPVATLEELGARLEFDARARDAAARIIEETKSLLLALRRTPADDGRTWEQAQLAAAQMKDGSLVLDLTRISEWRTLPVPGRSGEETYGIAEARIVASARERIGRLASEAMKDAFAKTSITSLVGPLPPGGATLSFRRIEGPDEVDLELAVVTCRAKSPEERAREEELKNNRVPKKSRDR